jgi:hypothetical protein
MRAFLVAALTLAMIGIASGQVWIMSPSGGGRASGSGAPPPPSVCLGVVDTSVGCALPMLGGIP